MKIYRIVCVAFLCIFSAQVFAEEYSFGVVPQQSAKKIAQKWGPILNAVSEKTGLSINLATAKDIPTFEKRLAAGEYDFAYMNPYHFTVFNRSPGYVAMAHQANKSIQGILVVHKDSDITDLSELGNEVLAFPSPAAFAATILPQADLNNRSIQYDPIYVSSHDSVYLNVARGLTVAGGGVMRTFRNTDPAVNADLKILWKTQQYTPHAFAAHPEIPENDRLLVQEALISLQEKEEGMALLKSINFGGIESAVDADWDDVRALNITTLSDLD